MGKITSISEFIKNKKNTITYGGTITTSSSKVFTISNANISWEDAEYLVNKARAKFRRKN